MAVRISGDASTVDLKEKQKVARTLNKLFDQTMSALDIISCTTFFQPRKAFVLTFN